MLRIITRLNVGGPAQQAVLLSERLDPRRFETLLVTGELGTREGDMLKLRPTVVRPMVVPGLGREIAPLTDVRCLIRIVRVIRGFQPHLVHTHLAKAGVLGRLAARIAGVPLVVHTFHGHAFRGYFDPARTRIFLELERAFARLSTSIIALSASQAGEIRGLGIAREPKLIEIPLGIELSRFLVVPRGQLRRELGIGLTDPLIGVVGRLAPIKRVDIFIEAMALVMEAEDRARFVVIGDGELRGKLEALASARRLDHRLHFLGWRADLPSVYGDLDVVVLTSDNEGTPVSILEALTAARPVVASAVGGVPDLLGSNERGVLVPPREPRRTADAVLEVLGSPDRARAFGLAGRDFVYPAYDAATLVRRVEGLYNDLAFEHGILERRPGMTKT